MDIVVPDLGDVGEVKVARWLKRNGEEVESGEAVVEVEADKAVFVVEAQAAGVLDRIVVGEGQIARPGEAIARLRNG